MRRYELAYKPDTFWPFRSFFADLDQFFREVIPPAAWDAPAVDIQEKDDRYIVTADLPGYEKGEINIELNDGILTLSAQHNEETKEEKDGYLRRERRVSSFSRSFRFDKPLDADKVKADLKNGVLTVDLPKSEQKPAGRKIELQ